MHNVRFSAGAVHDVAFWSSRVSGALTLSCFPCISELKKPYPGNLIRLYAASAEYNVRMTLSDEMVEGSLGILWENRNESRATPRYTLSFSRYRNFRGGAQPTKHLVGMHALESYLVEINFTPEDAKHQIERVTEGKFISIPSVFLSDKLLSDYDYPV